MNFNDSIVADNAIEHSRRFQLLPWRAKFAARILRNKESHWMIWIYLSTSAINVIAFIYNPSQMQFALAIMFFVFAVQSGFRQGTKYLFSLTPTEISALKLNENTVEQDAAANP